MYTKYTEKAIDDSCDRLKEILEKVNVEPEKIEELVRLNREVGFSYREEDLKSKRRKRSKLQSNKQTQ